MFPVRPPRPALTLWIESKLDWLYEHWYPFRFLLILGAVLWVWLLGYVRGLFWGVLLWGGLALAVELIGHGRQKRIAFRERNQLCLRCGYDLRATPDRCPECGTPVASTQQVG